MKTPPTLKQVEDYTEDFLKFWKKYPARWNSNLSVMVKRKKYPAFLSWQKLSPDRQIECLRKAKYIKQTEGTPRDCVTWLNQRGWDDIELPEDKPKPLPTNIVPIMKGVPEGDKRPTSDKVNEARRKLGEK